MSGVGIPLTPLSAAALEELLFIKQVPNGLHIALDYLTQWTAVYRRTGGAGLAAVGRRGGPRRQYSINLAGDFLASSSTGTTSQLWSRPGETVKGVAGHPHLGGDDPQHQGRQKAFLQAFFGVWGGVLFPDQGEQPSGATLARAAGGERPADGSGRMPPAAAAEIILGELGQMTAAHGVGNEFLAGAEAFLADGMAQLEDLAAAASGTRDPFVAARDAITESLSESEDRIAQLTGIGEMSAQGNAPLHRS